MKWILHFQYLGRGEEREQNANFPFSKSNIKVLCWCHGRIPDCGLPCWAGAGLICWAAKCATWENVWVLQGPQRHALKPLGCWSPELHSAASFYFVTSLFISLGTAETFTVWSQRHHGFTHWRRNASINISQQNQHTSIFPITRCW